MVMWNNRPGYPVESMLGDCLLVALTRVEIFDVIFAGAIR